MEKMVPVPILAWRLEEPSRGSIAMIYRPFWPV